MKALLIAALIALANPALAHGPQKGPNGGPMEDVAGVHIELVKAGNTLTLNVFDEDNKPIPTEGFSASVLVVSGAQRETIKLDPHSPNLLKGDAKTAPASGANVTVTIRTKAGKSGQAKFKL